jgi:predicted Zn-dependent protease with MMP-like domain
MKREDFVKIAEETLDSLPEEFRSRIQNVAILSRLHSSTPEKANRRRKVV